MKKAQLGRPSARSERIIQCRNASGFMHTADIAAPIVFYCTILMLLTWSTVSVVALDESMSGEMPRAASLQYPGSKAEADSATIVPSSSSRELNSSNHVLAAADAGDTAAQEIVLPNGMKVVLLEEHSFPVVSCLVWYKVGSRHEKAGATGLSHLVEHLLFQNIGDYKHNELGASIVANGGQFNGFTSEDFTTFYSTVPASKLDLVLHGESERMRNAKFTRVEVQEEVNNLLREFDREAKDPLIRLNREVHAVAYQQHPYRNPPGGWRNDAEHLTYEDARAFYERYFCPNNASLVLVGDFKKEAVLPLLKKYFYPLAKAPEALSSTVTQERVCSCERRITLKHAGRKDYLVVAYAAPPIADNDSYAMSVLEKLLNGQISGRLKKQFVDTRICSAAQSSFELKKDPGLFSLSFTASGGTPLQKVLDMSDVVVNQLRAQMVSDAELSRAKKQAEFDFFNETDGPYMTGFHLGYFETLMDWQVARTWPDKLRAVTASDVQRVARRYLSNDARVVGQLVSTAPACVPAPGAKSIGPAANNLSGKSVAQKTSAAVSAIQARGAGPISGKGSGIFANLRMAAYKETDSMLTPSLLAEANVYPEPAPITPLHELESLAPKRFTVHEKSIGLAAPLAIRATMVTSTAREGKIHAGSNAVTYKTLSNGLEVVVIESHLNPIVQLTGCVKAGSIYEPVEKRGLSALAAALLNCGGAKSGRQQLIAEQDDLGLPPEAMIKFDSGLEEIKFQTRCLAKDFYPQLTRLFTSIREPKLQDSDLEKAKSDFLQSMSIGEDPVSAKVERALLRSMIPAQSPYYPVDPSEKAKSISTLKQSDLRDFVNSHVVPNATAIVVAGDVEAPEVIAYLERLVSSWSAKSDVAKPPILASDRRGAKSSLPLKDGFQNLVCLGRLIATAPHDRDEKAWSDLLIADCALTNHPIFSRINQRLETEPELALSFKEETLKAHLQPLSEAIIWSLYLPLEAASSGDSIAAIQNELKHYGNSGLTMAELIEAKRYLLGAIPVNRMANLESLNKFELEGLVQRREPDPLAKDLSAVRAASLDSVNKFIFGAFKPDQATLVVAGSRQLIKQIHPVRPEVSTEH